MSSFCTAKATHIFFSKKSQHICISLDVNFKESLTNDIVSFEQLGPAIFSWKKESLIRSYAYSYNTLSSIVVAISYTRCRRHNVAALVTPFPMYDMEVPPRPMWKAEMTSRRQFNTWGHNVELSWSVHSSLQPGLRKYTKVPKTQFKLQCVIIYLTICTIFNLITLHIPISAHSNNFVVFRLQPKNLYLLYKSISSSRGNSNEYPQHMLL